MKLVIGGAFQGKLDFAKKMTGKETGWADGAAVSKEELSACSGVYDFQELVRRWLLLEEENRDCTGSRTGRTAAEKSGNLHCYE